MRPCQWSCPHHSTIRLTFAGTGPIFNRMVESSELQNAALDDVFHALSDATRRAMLQHLSDGETSVGALAAPHAMSLAAASKHIRVLESAGLVRRRVDGRTHRVSLDAAPLHAGLEWIRHYEQFWTTRLDRLAELLAADTPAPPSPPMRRRRTP